MEAELVDRRVPLPIEGDPRDIIELNHDIYKPSVKYSEVEEAVQKDMVLANLSQAEIGRIKLQFSLIEPEIVLINRDPVKYKALNVSVNNELKDIIQTVSLSRGALGFTAKLMRKTIHEQRSTMGYEMGREKQREGIVKQGRQVTGL